MTQSSDLTANEITALKACLSSDDRESQHQDGNFWLNTKGVNTVFDAMAVARKEGSMMIVRKKDGTVRQVPFPELDTVNSELGQPQ
jgi:hypothetical protein